MSYKQLTENRRNRGRNSKKAGLAALIFATILLASCPPPDPDPDPGPGGDNGPSLGTVLTDKEIELDAENSDPWGIWASDTHMYVSDDAADKLFAYNLSNGSRDESKEFDLSTSNDAPRGVWSDGTTIWVADFDGLCGHAYDLADKTSDSPNDIDCGGDAVSPTGIWGNDETIWALVGAGGGPFPLAIKRSDKSHDPPKHFGGRDLIPADLNRLGGLWSDGTTTIWVSSLDPDSRPLYAYQFAPGENTVRDEAKDFTTLVANGNTMPRGLHSDGTTMWVVDGEDDKIYAYSLGQ